MLSEELVVALAAQGNEIRDDVQLNAVCASDPSVLIEVKAGDMSAYAAAKWARSLIPAFRGKGTITLRLHKAA